MVTATSTGAWHFLRMPVSDPDRNFPFFVGFAINAARGDYWCDHDPKDA